MNKFLLAASLLGFSLNVKAADDCDYPLILLSELTEICATQNAEFQASCSAEQQTSPFGSAFILSVDAGSNRSKYYCKYLTCHTNEMNGGMADGVLVPNECLPVDPPPVNLVLSNGSFGPPRGGCSLEGSIIQTASQVIGETVPVAGASFYLSHFSSRLKGRIADYTSDYKISENTINSRITGFIVEVADENGIILSTTSFPAIINQNFHYQWDGMDNGVETWGARVRRITIKTSASSAPAFVDQVFEVMHGNFKAKKLGLGGWVPSNWEFYDSVTKKLYLGDGNARIVNSVTDGSYQRIATEDGSEVHYYDQIGRIAFVKTGLTGVVILSFNYRTDGKLASIVDAFNKVKTFNYNANGKLINLVTAENVKTKFSQDMNGNIISITNPKNETYSMTYKNADGLMLTFTKPSGNVTTFTYDNEGKLINDVNSSGKFTSLHSGFHSIGFEAYNSVQATTAMGRVYTNTYDINNSTEVFFKPLRTDRYKITDDEFSSTTEGGTANITYGLDARFGKQVRTPDKIEQQSIFGQDKFTIENNVNLSSQSNVFSIDSLTRIVSSGDSEYVYEYNGLTKTNTLTSKLGRTSYVQIDELERPVQKQTGTFNPVSYIYEGELLTRYSQGDRHLVFSYNNNNLVKSIKNSRNEKTLFTYDEAQRLNTKTLPDGRVVYFNYDSNGNLTSLTPPNRPAHSFSYGVNEKLSIYNPPLLSEESAVSTSYSYNLDRDLIKITRPDGKEINFNYDIGSPDGYHQRVGVIGSITGSFGQITLDYFNDSERVSKITSEDGSSIEFTVGSGVGMIAKNEFNQRLYEYNRKALSTTNSLMTQESLSPFGIVV